MFIRVYAVVGWIYEVDILGRGGGEILSGVRYEVYAIVSRGG